MSDNLTNSDKIINAKFKPRARLLLQLGDQLIKNESIALVELVKNAYDADANNVDIIMEKVDDAENGTIIIEDNGTGMDLNIVENVWLEPGSDYKSEKFDKLQATSKYNRLPIGEKGIGRFGVHKLGNKIELTTKMADSKEVYVEINWDDFGKERYLEDVPIQIIERETPLYFRNGKTGTNIVIKDLRKSWEKLTAQNVKRSITALISPFDSVDSFKTTFDVLDKPGWFEKVIKWEDIKKYSLFHFKAVLSKDLITAFDYDFIPWASMPKLSPRHVGVDDELLKIFSSTDNSLSNPSVLNTVYEDKELEIGELVFEGYIFDRDSFVMKLGVSDKKGFKSYLEENGGIKVFRDGLRVYDYGEPENDWLNLDQRRFLQPAKRISNSLVLGAIRLNREDSRDLIEKTNREGFVENFAYSIFKEAILHTIEIVETLRYSDKLKLREAYGPSAKSEPVLFILSDLKSYVDKNVNQPEVRKEISKYLVKIESDYKRINETLLNAAGAGLSMSVVIHEIEKIIIEVEKVIKAENASERVIKLVKHLASLIDGYSDIISRSEQTTQNLIDVIEQSLFNTEYRLSSHTIKIEKAYQNYAGISKVKVTRNLLIGSLMNLVDNSIFWLEKAKSLNDNLNKKIFIGLFDEGEYLNIVIADNGTGFLLPTEEITEPFVSAKPGGMGLGLHIVSEIMLAQEGKLTFPDWGDFDIPDEYENGAVIALGFKK